MNALEAVTEKVRLELIVKKATRKCVETSRGLVELRWEGVAEDPSRNLKSLISIFERCAATKEEIGYLVDACGLALRSCQYRIASEIAWALLVKFPGAEVLCSLPFSEGDRVLAAGEEGKSGTIIMQTSPTHYAVRFDSDGNIRKMISVRKLRAAGGTMKKIRLAIPVRDFGDDRDQVAEFCKGFASMGPVLHKQLFPHGLQNDADADIDCSKFPALFGGTSKHARECLYTLGKILDRQALYRVSLDMEGNWLGPKHLGAIAPHLKRLSRLKELRLGKNGIGFDGAKVLASVIAEESMPALELLDVRRNALGPEGVRRILSALTRRNPKRFHNDESGSMYSSTKNVEGGDASGMSKNERRRRFRYLDLSSNFAGCAGARYLADALSSLPYLESLYFRGNDVKTTGFAHICHALGAPLSMTRPSLLTSRIRELDMSYNPSIGPDGVKSLVTSMARSMVGESSKIPLEKLCLRRVNMRTEGAEMLATVLPSMLCLHDLDLGDNGIEREGGKALCEAIDNDETSIQNVSIANNCIGVAEKRRIMTRFFRERKHPQGRNGGVLALIGQCRQDSGASI